MFHTLKRKFRSCCCQQDAVSTCPVMTATPLVLKWRRHSHLSNGSGCTATFKIIAAKSTDACICLDSLGALRAFFCIYCRSDSRIIKIFDAQNVDYRHNKEKHSVNKPREECSTFRCGYSADDTAENYYKNQSYHRHISHTLYSILRLLDPCRIRESSFSYLGEAA